MKKKNLRWIKKKFNQDNYIPKEARLLKTLNKKLIVANTKKKESPKISNNPRPRIDLKKTKMILNTALLRKDNALLL
jgi:hypothetical protein